jgi:hydrogenase large subunit
VAKIVVDPLTRIEGHLKIDVTIDGGQITDARSSGMMFRGFELLLKGRDPFDAQFLVQRICGVCPIAHAMAATLNLDSAFGIADQIPDNGRIIRNLIQGANYIQSHILHFYHLAALDYVDVTKVTNYQGKDAGLNSVKDFIQRALSAGNMSALGPFYPRYEGDYRLSDDLNIAATAHYVDALNMRRLAQEMAAIFCGKLPHNAAIVPGGVTEGPTVDKIANFMWKLQQLRDFIDNTYLPDVIAVAEVYSDYFTMGKGCGNLYSTGVFDLDVKETNLDKRKRLLKQGTTSASNLVYNSIDSKKVTEDVKNSWYTSPSGLYPGNGQTAPNPEKAGGYSWIKAPRYNGTVCEVGPLARMVMTYLSGDTTVKKMVDDTLAHFKAAPSALFSVLGRHAARALEAKFVADMMAEWLLELKPGEPCCAEWQTPDEAEGMGAWEAPRGSVAHWIKIENKKIANYQCVPPTNWNGSPRDDKGNPGPIEQALIGTKIKDTKNPFEIGRIVRSFDP